MPDIVTHATFALEIIENIKNEKLIKMLNKNKFIYMLGSQGPDTFYFYKLFSLKKDKNFSDFGNYMHDYYTNEFLIECIKYLKNNYSDVLYSYVLGLICHHVLDRNTHPYVYYVTGIDEIKNRGNHLRLERAIDSIFINEKWNVSKPHRFKIYKNILNYKLDKNIFVPFYNNVLEKVFNKQNGGYVFINSAINFRRFSKLIYDPMGIKKKISIFTDKYFNKKGKIVFETLFHYNNINAKIDYMNLNHSKWVHPVNGVLPSNESFMDLYNKGINEACDEFLEISNYINGIIDESDLNKVITNLSYSTGFDWEKGSEMKYFNVIF